MDVRDRRTGLASASDQNCGAHHHEHADSAFCAWLQELLWVVPVCIPVFDAKSPAAMGRAFPVLKRFPLYAAGFLRRIAAKPPSPATSSRLLAGSGTADTSAIEIVSRLLKFTSFASVSNMLAKGGTV